MSEQDQPECSSRIFIQGLPPYADEKRLREMFAERGDVTDVKVIRTKAGHSRQFGFIGFTTVEQAKDSIQYFNNSYIDTSRIQVKFAEKSNSQNLARPWSKYSEGSTQYKKRHRDEDAGEKKLTAREAKKLKQAKKPKDSNPEDPELAEFLEVMQPRSKTAMWSNDASKAQAANQAAAGKKGQKHATQESLHTDDEDDELYEDLSAKGDKAKSKTPKGGKKRKARGGDSSEDEDDNSDEPAEVDPLVQNNEVSDLDYLKSKVKADKFKEEFDSNSDEDESSASEEDFKEEDEEANALSSEESEEDEGASEGSDRTGLKGDGGMEEPYQDRKKSHSEAGPREGNELPAISETGRLFLRNLPYQATEADLTALFQDFGELSEVHLVVDRVSGKSKGFALVQFMEPADAEAAFSALDGSIFQGRLLHILPAKLAPQPKISETAQDEDEDDSGDFKKKKAAERKTDAGNRQAWNTLFMRPDTVAEAIAAHFNVTKAELLSKDAADLPVRMALGEAHVVALTKKGLEEGGADITALEQAALASGKASTKTPGIDRSSTVLLVKNLPYSATETELLDLFGSIGSITRLVLPDTRTVALVEFQNASDARRAFQSLAYKKFQNAPLFLEWAPKHIFKLDAPLLDKTTVVQPTLGLADADDLEAADNATESSSIYVKNVAWSTTDQRLMKLFDPVVSAAGGTIRAAKVAKRKDSSGKVLSAGYAFVECSSEAIAKLTIRKLQNALLDGHKLQLQLSMKKGLEADKPGVKAKEKNNTKATKIVVRNVAFEAKSQEVRSVFQPFGQVKSVRVPRKFDGSHRGFAFVDFLSHKEAVSAMEAVNGIHLYGRRLVCEWAAQEEGLDELRAKTATKFDGQA